MRKKPTTLSFEGTPEQEELLHEMIRNKKGEPACLLPILQEAQNIYGYLPIEVQKMVAGDLQIPLEEVYGAVTFYDNLLLVPKGKYELTICLGTACHGNGSDKVYEKVQELTGIEAGECTSDRLFSITERHCVGACAVGPILMVNDQVYSKMTPEKAEVIIMQYRQAAEMEAKAEEVKEAV